MLPSRLVQKKINKFSKKISLTNYQKKIDVDFFGLDIVLLLYSIEL